MRDLLLRAQTLDLSITNCRLPESLGPFPLEQLTFTLNSSHHPPPRLFLVSLPDTCQVPRNDSGCEVLLRSKSTAHGPDGGGWGGAENLHLCVRRKKTPHSSRDRNSDAEPSPCSLTN